MLEPNSFPAGTEAMRGLKVEDAPAPDQLPLFNKTPFQHFFVPITLDSGVVGILRVWFGNPDPELRQSRVGPPPVCLPRHRALPQGAEERRMLRRS